MAKKRFKTKQKKGKLVVKGVLFIFVFYLIYCFYYRRIYLDFKNKFFNHGVIDDIVTLSNKESGVFERYVDPKFILNDALKLPEDETNDQDKVVINEVNKTQVYIYSTHDGEEYYDEYLNIYNIRPNVKTASFILQDYLNQRGINCYVNQKSVAEELKSNGWAYNRSYDAVRNLIYDDITKNNYKLIIDLHRDSSLENKTLLEVDGKRYAKVLFVVGASYQGYETNLSVANKLSEELEKKLPGLSRGVLEKSGAGVNGIYNQDLTKNMVLIEMGGVNTRIEDLNNTMEILASVISSFVGGLSEE